MGNTGLVSVADNFIAMLTLSNQAKAVPLPALAALLGVGLLGLGLTARRWRDGASPA